MKRSGSQVLARQALRWARAKAHWMREARHGDPELKALNVNYARLASQEIRRCVRAIG